MRDRQSPGSAAFVERGFLARDHFDHQVVTLSKQYDDLLLHLQSRGFSMEELGTGSFRQLNLYATRLDGLPDELFTSPTVNWHRQQFGRKGLVAAASLYLAGDGAVVVDTLQSDLCQQLSRDPELKRRCSTRVEKLFGAWYKLTWNAVLDFAIRFGAGTVYCPTLATVLAGARPSLVPQLFERIYGWVPFRYRCRETTLHGSPFWELSVAENRDRIVPLDDVPEATSPPRPPTVICVFHDIEEDVDTPVSAQECRLALTRMLEVERAAGVTTTYNVVGTMFREKAPLIASSDPAHALGFHSFNHKITDLSQLRRVREVNLKVRGYRPPRSVLTPELTDYRLSYHNFEWLLNAAGTLASDDWRLENGLVKIPVHLDDYPLHTGRMAYTGWKALLLGIAEERRFVAVGLHDCYARWWIDDYPELLAELRRRGELWTCDQVSAHAFLHGTGPDRPADGAARSAITRETWLRFVQATRVPRPES